MVVENDEVLAKHFGGSEDMDFVAAFKRMDKDKDNARALLLKGLIGK